MSESEDALLSRRETLKLAKFGALLATGLSITESSWAQQHSASGGQQVAQSLGQGALVLKLYSESANTFKLLSSVEMSSLLLKAHSINEQTVLTFKFWNPALGAKNALAHTIKLSNAAAHTLKLNLGAAGETMEED